MGYTYIIYERIYNNSDNERIKESNKGNKDNSIRNIRGDPMEINKGVQEKGLIKCSICNKEFSNNHDLRTHEGMVHKQLYHNKEWLKEQYLILKKSTLQIAQECNCHSGTIGKWLKKFDISRRSLKEANHNRIEKGFISPMKGKNHSIDSINKISKNRKGKNKGKNNPNWKGDNLKFKNKDGYFFVRGKPRYNRKSKYIKEHTLIMEQSIGRPLWDWEVIHHINENKIDNQIENLFLCQNMSQHSKIHHQLGKIAIELMNSNKFGKIKFNKEKGRYYIIFIEEDSKS